MISQGITEIPAITVIYAAPENDINISRFLAKVGIEALEYQQYGGLNFHSQEGLKKISKKSEER